MQNQVPAHQSLFESMAAIMEPFNQAIESMIRPEGYIIDMDYQCTIDKIIVILPIASHPKGKQEYKTEVFVIDKEYYRVWAEMEGLLVCSIGQWDEECTTNMDFDEYQAEHMDKHDVAQYLAKNSMVNKYAWVYPTPHHNYDINLKRLEI
jgi:hypothetical protein